jgi:hypothetical protein
MHPLKIGDVSDKPPLSRVFILELQHLLALDVQPTLLFMTLLYEIAIYLNHRLVGCHPR